MRKTYLFLIVFFIFSFTLRAQNGAVLLGGISVGYPDNPMTGLAKGAQSGWHVGLTTRLGEDFWYWRLGVELHKVNLKAAETFRLFKNEESAYFVKFPLQLGARVLKRDQFGVHVTAGGNVSYIWSIEDNTFGLDHNTMTDVQFGALFGAGVDFGPFVIDFNFEKGLTKLYTDTDFKADYWYLGMGFFF